MKKTTRSDIIARIQSAPALPTSICICEPKVEKKSRYQEAPPPQEMRRRRLIEALLKGRVSNGELPPMKRLDLREARPNEILALLDQARNLSLFDSTRIFELTNAEELSQKEALTLAETLSKIPEGATVIVSARGLEATDPIRRFHKERDTLIELEPFAEGEERRWLAHEWKRAGVKQVTEELLDATLAVAGNDLDAAVRAIEQGALLSDGEKLSAAEFLTLFPQHTTPQDYELASLLAAGKLPDAELLIHELLLAERSSFALLGMLNRAYLTYFTILLAGRAGAAQALKIQPKMMWRLDKDCRTAPLFTPAGVARALKAILRADGILKNRSLGDEEVLARAARHLLPAR